MATQLKEAGNAAFVQKDFGRAHALYSEAIALDGRNAVLYANRSACSFGMSKYIDALRDAQQATEIDPGYAKGWSRLATAHEAALEFTGAVTAWRRALDALPEANPSPAETKQRAQYAAALEKSEARLEAHMAQPFPGVLADARDKAPWQVAEEMMPALHAQGRAMYASSAYLIYSANKEWEEGIGYMKSLKKIPVEGVKDGYQIIGHTGGLTSMTNGLMRDLRVIRLDSSDWIQKYNDQVCFEAQKYGAWTSESLENIQRLALKRLKKEGWDALRPALAVVVRGWIMRAVFDGELRQAPHMAVERLKETLQLLHWGRQVWRDVHKDDRGVIFQDTFVRGIKVIYLSKMTQMHATAAKADKQAILDTLLQEARELIEDVEKAPRPTGPVPAEEGLDPGFVSSFYIYPAAEAYAAAGYCFMQQAGESENVPERMVNYAMAAQQYTQAAQIVPEDDEKHCWFLNCTIQPMLSAGAPKETIMGTVGRIRATMPKMRRIWANSALAKQGRDAMIEATLRAAEGK